MPKIFFKKLAPRPFKAIHKGTKTIEIRAKKNKFSKNCLSNAKKGDIIVFTNTTSDEYLSCVIERIAWYKNVRLLLEKEGTKKTLSSTNCLEEGIKSIEAIGNYKELIAMNGVFAIQLRAIQENLNACKPLKEK